MFQRKVKITQVKREETIDLEDTVLIEQSIDIIINSKPLVSIVCLSKDLKELAIGFLFSIGIIDSIEDIKKVSIDELDHKINVELHEEKRIAEILEINPISRVIDTTCGIPSPWRKIISSKLEDSKIKNLTNSTKKSTIFSIMKNFQKESKLFKETGGCHGAAIYTLDGKLIDLKEDIGRHNAIDKVIGTMILKNQEIHDKILATSGRLTGDSVLKAVRAEIPIVSSLSAAIESGIRLAFAYDITLIGFVRGARFNIYSHPERIIEI